jgi:hypothetical protein
MHVRRGYTISAIRAANKRAGQHFFDPGTMRFFRSRTINYVYEGPGGVFFVTSESNGSDGNPRLFTVRRFWPDTSEVETANQDCYGLPSLSLARKRASNLTHSRKAE